MWTVYGGHKVAFRVLKGEDMNRSYLDKVIALDKKVYGPIGEKAGEDFVGTIENMEDLCMPYG